MNEWKKSSYLIKIVLSRWHNIPLRYYTFSFLTHSALSSLLCTGGGSQCSMSKERKCRTYFESKSIFRSFPLCVYSLMNTKTDFSMLSFIFFFLEKLFFFFFLWFYILFLFILPSFGKLRSIETEWNIFFVGICLVLLIHP
jgi:hypothetical protein